MNILVVGGAGYIGSHVCKEISTQGWVPIVYDNLSTGHRWAVKWGPLEVGDIQQKDVLREVLKRYNPYAVVHLAACAYVGESVVEPEKYYYNNVAGTVSLLSTMREQGIKKIVFSSSCATYGVPKTIPITEDMEQIPVNPYGRSKLMVEQILKDFSTAYGSNAVCLRYFNAAGADPEGECGEVHQPETHIIPLAIDVARGKKERLTVFGNDYQTKDGTCIRDYTHVSDLARAHVAAVKYMQPDENPVYNAFNLGIGKGYSVLEVIKEVESIAKKKVPYTFSDRRDGDPPTLVSNPKKAEQHLKWEPTFTSLGDMVNHAWLFSNLK